MGIKSVNFIIITILLFVINNYADLQRVESNIDKTNVSINRPDMVISPVGQYPNQGTDLWNAFYLQDALPSGVTNLKAEFPNFTAGGQVGTYKYIPPIAGVKMKDGIVLTSGIAAEAKGPNNGTADGQGGNPGGAELDAASGYPTFDAAILSLSFTTDGTVEGFTFSFSFGTEEFPEYVGKQFNDVFLVLLDGVNVCKDSKGGMININNMFFDIDNTDGSEVNLQYDGFTYVLKSSTKLTPGNHTLKFAICDATDYRLDSGVFLSDFKFEFDNTIMIPEVNIVDDTEFLVAPTQVSDFLVGTIENQSNWGPVTIDMLGSNSEFHLDGWDILTSNPTDIKLNDEFSFKVVGKLDTTFAGQPWVVYDTATMTVKVEGNPPWPEIESATILDDNGDGFADSISVELEYAFPEVYSLKSADFSWPQNTINYSENITNGDLVTSSVIGFGFNPDAGATIVTDGSSSIDISIDSTGKTVKHSSTLKDGIGPLLKDATVVKRYIPAPDSFTINLTESVNTADISGKSFILIKSNKEIEISPVGAVTDAGNNTKLKFLIADLGDDAPEEGDSLQILSSGSCKDLVGNSAHPENTPVPIKFSDGSLEDFPEFDKATVYDKDGNGIGDSVVIKLATDIPTGYKYKTADFSWPENEFDYSFNVEESMFLNGNTLPKAFTPNAAATIQTSGSSSITLTLDSLGKDIEKSTDLVDGIGPLLIDATVIERYNPGVDSFTINLTESVKVSDISGKSFILIKKNHAKEIEIEPINSVTDLSGGTELQFNIADLGNDAPAEGDSLQILSSGPVKDQLNNKAHKDNTPVPIEFDDGSLDEFPEIEKAIVYDKNGDGIGDSITIELSENLPNAYLLKESKFSWPKDQFSYNKVLDNNILINKNIIPFSFNADPASPVQTEGESDLTLTVDSLNVDVSRESKLLDGIGPILKTASVVKRYTPGIDTIRVTLSESVVASDISGKSFILVKENNAKEIEIYPLGTVTSSNGETSLLFTIVDLEDDAPAPGDSLKILSTGPVKDKRNNSAHKDNPPVPFEFLDGSVPVEAASYYDTDGDGIVDQIIAVFADTVNSLDSISFIAQWEFGINTNEIFAEYESNDMKTVVIDFMDGFSNPDKVKDRTSGDMTLIVKTLNKNAINSYPVSDSAAPVIIQAIYYPQSFNTDDYRAAKDSLQIFFSEPISDISSSRPFWFEDESGSSYYMTLSKKSQSSIRASFTINEISKNGFPMEGDSVWINYSENVSDTNGTAQSIDDNKRVPLKVITPPFILEPIVLAEKRGRIPEELQLNGAVEKGIVIFLKPNIHVPAEILEQIEYKGTIFDATGNIVTTFETDSRDEKRIECGISSSNVPNGITILWSTKNGGFRDAGSSMYVCSLQITYPDDRTSESNAAIPVHRDN